MTNPGTTVRFGIDEHQRTETRSKQRENPGEKGSSKTQLPSGDYYHLGRDGGALGAVLLRRGVRWLSGGFWGCDTDLRAGAPLDSEVEGQEREVGQIAGWVDWPCKAIAESADTSAKLAQDFA